MKQISIESLRADLQVEIELIIFFSILYCIKLHEVKH
jgi:hypothetical protein